MRIILVLFFLSNAKRLSRRRYLSVKPSDRMIYLAPISWVHYRGMLLMMVKVFTILGKMIVVISCTNDLVQDLTPPQELIQILSLESRTGIRQSQDHVARRGPGILDAGILVWNQAKNTQHPLKIFSNILTSTTDLTSWNCFCTVINKKSLLRNYKTWF